MGRAPGLTRGGTGFFDDIVTGETVVRITDTGGAMVTNGLRIREFDFALLVELNAKFDGVGRAIFDALTASDAISGGDDATIVTGNGVIGLEFLDRTESEASATAAIANGGRVAIADGFDIGDAVH